MLKRKHVTEEKSSSSSSSSNSSRDILSCSLCKQKLNAPVALPNCETICEKHLKDFYVLGQKVIRCPICNEAHNVPKTGFKRDKAMEILLKVPKSDKHELAKNAVSQLGLSLKEIKKLTNDPESYIHDFIEKIRFEIDEKMNRDIKSIYDQRDGLLNKLARFEQDCKLKTSESLFFVKEAFTAASKQFKDWKEKVSFIFLQDNISDEIIQNSDKTIKELEKELLKGRQALMRNVDCHFTPNVTSMMNIGVLEFIEACSLQTFLSSDLSSALLSLIQLPKVDKLELIYQGTRDGFLASDFHSKCDGIAQTLTVIKTLPGYIFGGYTDCAWDSSGDNKMDPSAYIFSLINTHNQPTIFKTKSLTQSIFCLRDWGPIFGNGDLQICSNAHKILPTINKSDPEPITCYTNLGNTYSDLKFNSNVAKTFLAGSERFQITDIAVFQRKQFILL